MISGSGKESAFFGPMPLMASTSGPVVAWVVAGDGDAFVVAGAAAGTVVGAGTVTSVRGCVAGCGVVPAPAGTELVVFPPWVGFGPPPAGAGVVPPPWPPEVVGGGGTTGAVRVVACRVSPRSSSIAWSARVMSVAALE